MRMMFYIVCCGLAAAGLAWLLVSKDRAVRSGPITRQETPIRDIDRPIAGAPTEAKAGTEWPVVVVKDGSGAEAIEAGAGQAHGQAPQVVQVQAGGRVSP